MIIRKLSVAILAVFLSLSAFAGDVWTDHGNGKQRNQAVAASAECLHRGGALLLDTTTLQQELLWAADADNDSITLDFILPGALENIAATPVGWEGDVAGSAWRAGVADLDGVKGGSAALAAALAEFQAPGAQSYVRIPIGEVPASGEWRPVQKQLGGDWEDFRFTIQPALTAQEIAEGSAQPDWSIDSIAIYHKTKRHDIVDGAKYMTGKAAHLPAPVAVGFRANGTTITGWCFGAWEVDEVTGILTKVFDASVIDGWSAQTASVVVDATLGYTAVGAKSTLSTKGFYGEFMVATEDGTLESLSFADVGALSHTIFSSGFYNGTSYAGSSRLAHNEGGAGSESDPWATLDMTASMSTSGTYFGSVGKSASSDFPFKYDDASGFSYAALTTNYSPWPDPSPAVTLTRTSRRFSMYITYSVASSPPEPSGDDTGLSLDLGIGL